MIEFTKTPFAPNTEGVWLNLPAEVYHTAPGISQSTLKRFDSFASPLHFKAAGPQVPTEDMQFGTACHTAILEPEKLKDSYYVRPAKFKPNEKDPWYKKHSDKPVISADRETYLPKIGERVRRLDPFGAALKHGYKEVSFFKRNADGILLKCRVDVLVQQVESDCWWIFDLKKIPTGWGDAENFGKKIADMGYHIQDAFYKYITGAQRFVFVAFDDDAPFDAVQWEPEEEDVNYGDIEWRRILDSYHRYLSADYWPGYHDNIKPVSMPHWAKKKMRANEFAAWQMRTLR